MPTPRSRLRTDGTVAWQVYCYYRDAQNIRQQFSATFDDRGEALLFADRRAGVLSVLVGVRG